MKIVLSRQIINDPFVSKIEELSGQNLLACYQCGKCSAGCPNIDRMDLLPNQIIRYAQLGLKDELLASKSIWICASCMTCDVRCPKGIEVAEVLESIRLILLRQRKDHLEVEKLSIAQKAGVPPIALIACLRKFTS